MLNSPVSPAAEVVVKNAAVGFRVHSGWTALVAVSLERGTPVVLLRQRPHLVKVFNYSFRQPYHTAAKMDRIDARRFVDDVRGEAEDLACGVLRAVGAELKNAGYSLNRGALLLSSGRRLPEFEKVLLSHALIHTADGELFREAILAAGSQCKMRMITVREKDLFEKCAEVFCRGTGQLRKQVGKLGEGIGAPWTQDEKLATLAGWLALASPVRAN